MSQNEKPKERPIKKEEPVKSPPPKPEFPKSRKITEGEEKKSTFFEDKDK